MNGIANEMVRWNQNVMLMGIESDGRVNKRGSRVVVIMCGCKQSLGFCHGKNDSGSSCSCHLVRVAPNIDSFHTPLQIINSWSMKIIKISKMNNIEYGNDVQTFVQNFLGVTR